MMALRDSEENTMHDMHERRNGGRKIPTMCIWCSQELDRVDINTALRLTNIIYSSTES